MDLLAILFLAIGLSMDSFAVSISNGLSIQPLSFRKSILISFLFAVTQTLLPLLGWLTGQVLASVIMDFDHWIAFGLLVLIGSKMLSEGFGKPVEKPKGTENWLTLLLQAIATSLDAFAIGISFALLGNSIVQPIIIIGITTFLFSFSGLQLGKFGSSRLGNNAEIAGGFILIVIGIKILMEHLFFA